MSSESRTVPPLKNPGRSRDVLSGFLVFLIALPLCLGISLASGCPAVAGVLTAIVGSLVCALISDSELTIKGPAAGLIVIVLGAVTEFKSLGFDNMQAYRMMLAVGVAAGVIQILFGLLKTGVLGEFFPSSAVHGLLAAIGIIIISKQIHVAMGVMDATGGPLALLAAVPKSLLHMNPRIALIGAVSLAILFGLPLIRIKLVRYIPAQMVVILVAMGLGSWMQLQHGQAYSMWGQHYVVNEGFLVSVPTNLIRALTSPDFRALEIAAAWKWVAMFAVIGSLESLLSAKAIDSLDPLKRKTNFNKDLLAIGVANTIAASLGGLPMISEIVRSKANIDNGARTRFSGVCHGLCLLAFVAFLPGLIHQIPMAALAAMLVYTGFRLASPSEFLNVAKIGREQLFVFVATIVGVLATDLLIGIGIGIACELAMHVYHGVPFSALFRAPMDIENGATGPCVIRAQDAAVFSNWISLRSKIVQYGLESRQNVVVDLSQVSLVDHSVMEKLHSLQSDFTSEGLQLEIRGLSAHQAVSEHWLSTRRLQLPKMMRISVVVDPKLESTILVQLEIFGGGESRIMPCTVVSVLPTSVEAPTRQPRMQIDMLMSERTGRMMLDYLSREILPANGHAITIERIHGLAMRRPAVEKLLRVNDLRA